MLSFEKLDFTSRNINGRNLFRDVSKTLEQAVTSNIILSSPCVSQSTDILQPYIAALENVEALSTKKNGINTEVSNICETVQDSRKSLSKKNRMKDSLIREGYMKVSEDLSSLCEVQSTDEEDTRIEPEASLLSEQCWECRTCNRRLKSEQGIRTHVYMVHILDGKEKNEVDCTLNSNSLSCEFCDKVLPNQDALYQHNVAKHSGKFLSLKPSWAAPVSICTAAVSIGKTISTLNEGVENVREELNPSTTETIPVQIPVNECFICGIHFQSKDLLDHHLLGWQPVSISKNFSCTQCQKYFSDNRGLLQHMNFCKINM